jgi:hypothetical protein
VLDTRILIVLAAMALSVRTFYWYYFDDAAREAMAGEDATQSVWRDLPFDGSGFARLGRTIWYYEPALLVACALGLGAWIAQVARVRWRPTEHGDALVVLSFVAPYLLLAGLFNQTYERFLLAPLPYLAAFAAFGMSRLPPLAACALLVVPLWTSTKLALLRGSPSTLDETAQWIRTHVQAPEERALFVLPPLDFPLFRTPESLRYPEGRAAFFSPWSRYQNRLPDERRIAPLYRLYWITGKPEFARLESDADVDAFVRSHGPGHFFANTIAPSQSPERARIVASLRRIGRLVQRISPDSDPAFTDHQLWDQDVEADGWRHVTWRVLRARAIGPVIEIYELP